MPEEQPVAPAVELSNDFRRVLWRTAVRLDKSQSEVIFTELANSWFVDERWPQADAAYQVAYEGLRHLAKIGPHHAALAPRFRRQAGAIFLFLGYLSTAGGYSPLTQLELLMRAIAIMMAQAREGRPDPQWALDQVTMTMYENNWQNLQALVLEGAGLDLATHRRETSKLRKSLEDNLAQSWRRMNSTAPLPPLRYRHVFAMLKADGKAQGIVAAMVNMNEAGDNVFVQVSLPQLGLQSAIARHGEIPPGGAGWDPCLSLKGLADNEQLVLHEAVHALSAVPGYTEWSGLGWQQDLAASKARLEEGYGVQFPRFWQIGLSQMPYPRRIDGFPTRALSVPLHWLNEAFAETATRDILGRSDPDRRAITGLNRGMLYNPGIRLVRLIMAGRPPLEVLLAPEPVAHLIALVRAQLSPEASVRFLDFLFEQSAPFFERLEEAMKLMPPGAPQDLYSLACYPLISLWERDLRRQKRLARRAISGSQAPAGPKA